VQLVETVGIPVPQIVPFQFNPETLSRSLTPWSPPEISQANEGQESPNAQPFDPQEIINIKELHLDASDQLEEDDAVARLFGVADRIAAIENMLYAQSNPLSLVIDLAASLFGVTAPQQPTVAITLFVWGVGRIVPVRITEYTMEEQQFLPSLRPVRATLSLTLQVLPDHVFDKIKRPSVSVEIAKAAYKAHRVQQMGLTAVNTVSKSGELLALLPF
jgi:hypothetical protein